MTDDGEETFYLRRHFHGLPGSGVGRAYRVALLPARPAPGLAHLFLDFQVHFEILLLPFPGIYVAAFEFCFHLPVRIADSVPELKTGEVATGAEALASLFVNGCAVCAS